MTELQRLARRLADDYQFECHGGPLRNCQEWRALCEAIDSLTVDPPPRGASPQAETGEASVVAAIARHRMNHSDAWSTGFVAALGCCADDLPDEIVAIRPNRADLPDAKAYRRVYRRGFIEALARAAALVEAAVERTIAEFKQHPAPVSPVEPPSEDEDDDVPLLAPEGAMDSWSAPLRKPVPLKILSTDDFYALLRILEVLPADPFLSALQAKLSDEERRQHGNQASHLSGPEFVREIERVEALIQSRVQPPALSPVEPTPEPPQEKA